MSNFKINNLAIRVSILAIVLIAAAFMKVSLHLHVKLGCNNRNYHHYII